VKVAPVAKARWQSICTDCAGAIDSLIELLQGRFSKGVMDRVCRQKTGLFPSPDEIHLSCSCPDWADMCKHVAAVLYGIGARLDQRPTSSSGCTAWTKRSSSRGLERRFPRPRGAGCHQGPQRRGPFSSLWIGHSSRHWPRCRVVWRHSRGAEACESTGRQDGPGSAGWKSKVRAQDSARQAPETVNCLPGIPWLEKEMMPSYTRVGLYFCVLCACGAVPQRCRAPGEDGAEFAD